MMPYNDANSCILIVRSGHHLNDQAVKAVESRFATSHVLMSDDWEMWKDKIVGIDAKYVFNFLSDKILRGPILSRKTVNFHPAPPEYPGVGTACYALFDGTAAYGATAHMMCEKPDTGEILLVERFPILADDTCKELSNRAEQSCLDLLVRVISHMTKHQSLPLPCGEKWARKPFTRRYLEEWLILDPDDSKIFERKIRAARHPDYPGPYVVVHGHKFSLSND